MTLYDHHLLDGSHSGYLLEDVNAMFGNESFHTLKYSQMLYLPLEGDNGDEDEDDNGDNANSMEIDNATQSSSSNKQRLHNSKASNKLLAITPISLPTSSRDVTGSSVSSAHTSPMKSIWQGPHCTNLVSMPTHCSPCLGAPTACWENYTAPSSKFANHKIP